MTQPGQRVRVRVRVRFRVKVSGFSPSMTQPGQRDRWREIDRSTGTAKTAGSHELTEGRMESLTTHYQRASYPSVAWRTGLGLGLSVGLPEARVRARDGGLGGWDDGEGEGEGEGESAGAGAGEGGVEGDHYQRLGS